MMSNYAQLAPCKRRSIMLTDLECTLKHLLNEVQIPIPYFIGNGKCLPWGRAVLIAVFCNVFVDLNLHVGKE